MIMQDKELIDDENLNLYDVLDLEQKRVRKLHKKRASTRYLVEMGLLKAKGEDEDYEFI